MSAPSAPAAAPSRARHVALLVLLTLATCALVAGLGDLAVLGVLPVLLVALALAAWRVPLGLVGLGAVFLHLAVSNTTERPAEGRWHSPLAPLGTLLFENLNKTVPLGALRVALPDLLVAGLLVLVAVRRARGVALNPGGDGVPAAPAMRQALLLQLAGVVLCVGYGLATGGDGRALVWQVRTLVITPLWAFFLMAALRGPRDHRALGLLVLAAAWLKTLEGGYFYFFVARPQGWEVAYTHTHSDTMLFVVCGVMLLARVYERRDLPSGLLAVASLPPIFVSIVINNRRLAWVSLAAALLALFFLVPPGRFKRRVKQAAVLGALVMPLYVAAGWSSGSKLFKPVQLLKSITSGQSDSSTATRDIENFNLYWTLKDRPLLGTGFGHGYDEHVVAYDISEVVQGYRFVPHNSLLGLVAFTGWVGFSLLWFPVLLTVLLAVRGYRASRSPTDRAAALTCVATVVVYVNQAWGDMGLGSIESVFLMATAMVVAAKLAVATGAWPGPAPIPSPRSAP